MAMRQKKDQRKEVRKQLLGDILWSYASGRDEISYDGAIVDESESGLSILTREPVKLGSTLGIRCKGRPSVV